MKRRMILLLATVLLTGCVGKPAQPAAEYTGVLLPQDAYRTYYEIYVGGFADSNADGIGDLNGITARMDYLNDNRAASADSLHVGGLWLMPIHPSPTYHKYDVTDYYDVDPQYGTLADFDALAAECEARGVALVLDLVLNHTSSEHPWFQAACAALRDGTESEYLDWYQFSEEQQPDYHPVPGADGWYYNGQFWSGMPDLNLDSPAVRAELINIARFWLDRGAAGFRLDAVTSYYDGNNAQNTEFLRWLREALETVRPDVYLVGEAWADGGSILNLYQSGLRSFFNFPFSQSTGTMIASLRAGEGYKIAEAAEQWHAQITAVSPNAIDAPFLTNHDNARSAGALMNRPELQKQAAAIYLLLPGNPFIYYGEELGMRGGGERDEDKRMPFTWLSADETGTPNPPPGAQNTTRVAQGLAEQLADPDSLSRFYIDAIAVRNRNPALARGTPRAIDTGIPSLCAYEVTWQTDRLAVYHNTGTEQVDITTKGDLIDALAAADGQPTAEGGTLHLPPYSTAIVR